MNRKRLIWTLILIFFFFANAVVLVGIAFFGWGRATPVLDR
jgi:hypothetical protein